LLTGILLAVAFYRFGHRKYKIRGGQSPRSSAEVVYRLINYEETRFQFSILTLLALMFSVAIVSATVKWLYLSSQ
jgi:hypothetical protein